MAGLVLDANAVDDCRRLINYGRGQELDRIDLTDVTLSGAFEFACTRWHARMQGDVFERLGERWSHNKVLLRRAWDALVNRGHDVVEMHGAPPLEIRPVPLREDFDQPGWALFLQRFDRALRVYGGFEKKLAVGLSGALGEMVGNVVEHGARDGHPTPPAVVGFQVEKDAMTYAVADVGRGVLTSLSENPRWRQLRTSRDALDAAILQHATRRQQMRRGEGFSQAVRALADLHGHLRFRSGDAALILDGRGQTREAIQRTSTALVGLQLAVHCRLQRRV